MEITAIPNATYYGAAGSLFTAPDALLEDIGLLVGGKVGRWDYNGHCNGAPAMATDFKLSNAPAHARKNC